MNAVEAAWNRIEAALKTTPCEALAELRGPAAEASLEALDEAFRAVPAELPEDLEASLRRHDGTEGLLLGMTFPPADELVALYARLRQGEWPAEYFPLGTDEAGSFLCVHTTTHEVLEFDRSEGASASAAQGAFEAMDRVLAAHDALGALSVRGLALASLGRRDEAIRDLQRSAKRGNWLPGQLVPRQRLAELLAESEGESP